jgi:hypothetical protein
MPEFRTLRVGLSVSVSNDTWLMRLHCVYDALDCVLECCDLVGRRRQARYATRYTLLCCQG